MVGKAKFVFAATCIVFCAAMTAFPCSMKFPSYTVTQLRGKVVGHFFGSHVQALAPDWLRRWFSVSNAQLTLYEYDPDPETGYRGRVASTARSDSKGNFNFPKLENGRYVLSVNVKATPELGAFFFVEINPTATPTKSVTIDASPLLSDCSGGNYMLIDSTPSTKD